MHTLFCLLALWSWANDLNVSLNYLWPISKTTPIISSSVLKWRLSGIIQFQSLAPTGVQQMKTCERIWEKSLIFTFGLKHGTRAVVSIIHVTFWVSSQRNYSSTHESNNSLTWLPTEPQGSFLPLWPQWGEGGQSCLVKSSPWHWTLRPSRSPGTWGLRGTKKEAVRTQAARCFRCRQKASRAWRVPGKDAWPKVGTHNLFLRETPLL